MEPELPTLRPGAERTPVQYGQNFERSPLPPLTPEQGIERGAERREQVSEQGAQSADGAPALPAPVVSTAPPSASSSVAPVVDDLPIVAGDDDLIEKEWVDKAKKIIVDTKDDPYRREQEVARLQADYLKKRYGKELGAAE